MGFKCESECSTVPVVLSFIYESRLGCICYQKVRSPVSDELKLEELQKKHEEEKILWDAERDVLREEIESLRSELDEAGHMLEFNQSTLPMVGQQHQPTAVNGAISATEGTDVKNENKKLKTELEVTKQVSQVIIM